MLKNYFLTAWRNLWRNAFYSIINITGLAIGLAIGIMILLWVQDEFRFDRFHSHAESIYKINSHIGSGAASQVWSGAPAPLAVFCRTSIPEVIDVARIRMRGEQFMVSNRDKKFLENNTAYTDSAFFTLFDFKLLEGNRQHPFRDDHSIVITSSLAKKYFGSEDPMGKVLSLDGKENYTVTGVLRDFPDNSSIKYDILFPLTLFAKNFGGNGSWKTMDEDLGNFAYDTYLQVREDASVPIIEKKLTQIYHTRKADKDNSQFFALQSLTSIHLVTPDGNRSALQTVRIFLAVALLILFIACINYVNLSTARALLRSKEVSMRKIIGAARGQLFLQFILESAVLFLLASIAALLVIVLLLPLYNTLSGKHLFLNLSNAYIWLTLAGTIIGTLAIASIYPALLLSAFRPLEALKGKFVFGVSNALFRKLLVVIQFTFSVGLIIATIVIGHQLQFIRDKDLGFDKEQVLSFGLRDAMYDHVDAVRNELLHRPGISGVAGSDNNIISNSPNTTGDTNWDGKEPGMMFLIHPNGIDKDLIPLLKMKLTAGSNFVGSPADSAHLILNEAAIRQAGIKDPIGKRFTLWQYPGTIIGVVKDFNYASLKTAVEPTIFYYHSSPSILYVKTSGKEASKAIASVQHLWKKYNADFPFKYSFLDEDFGNLYKADQRIGTLFNVFALVAIIISCLGLFGLATYTAQLKTKEIGIRRVLGASVASVTALMAREFLALVAISFIIAAPLAWWLMNKWLQNYAYRITIGWWMFLLTGLLIATIALITVGFQAVKSALANPIRSLRTE